MSAERRPSFDRLLVLVPALAAGVAGAGIALWVSSEAEARSAQAQHRLGNALLFSLAGTAQEALSTRNDFLLVGHLGRTARLPYVGAMWVADAAGVVSAHGDSARVGEAVDPALLERLRGGGESGVAVGRDGSTLYGVCVRGSERVLGYAAVTLPHAWVRETSGAIRRALWVGALVAAFAGLLAGLWLRRSVRAARAELLDTTIEAARAAAVGDLGRVTVARPDEWGDAARRLIEALRVDPPHREDPTD